MNQCSCFCSYQDSCSCGQVRSNWTLHQVIDGYIWAWRWRQSGLVWCHWWYSEYRTGISGLYYGTSKQSCWYTALLEGESASTISVQLIINIIPQLHKESFPTLYAMAMDYLPIQASSVSCERVFSSSSETDMKKRNRINGLLMEALQMLKFSLKQDCLSINEHFPNMVEKDMDYDNLTHQMLPLLIFLQNSQTSLVEARCRMF